MKLQTVIPASFAIVSVLSASAVADIATHAKRTEAMLEAFAKDPVSTLMALPPKFNARSGAPIARRPRFSAEALASGAFVTQKDTVRRELRTRVEGERVRLADLIAGRSGYEEHDLAENLVDNAEGMLRSLEQMEARTLTKSRLPHNPWADNYWPMYQGGLSARYADEGFPGSTDWKASYDYAHAKENTFQSIYVGQNASSIDALSPAEKYDLLVGDARGGLTESGWSEGEAYARDNDGKVETWMGICQGWAAASYMLPRPKHPVELVAADGRTRIRFYPADIKALGSLLWAKVPSDSRFIGSRCNEKSPAADASGRNQPPECLDTNPGTWHMAVVNQIGVSRRSMVIDATYDYEVWNQPVVAYSYTYFNPMTHHVVDSLADARAPVGFDGDHFAGFRSGRAVAVVGVAMELTYISEVDPEHEDENTEEDDDAETVIYHYDLELDSEGEIVGGEWYSNAHPDFVWTPEPSGRAGGASDEFVSGSWDPRKPIPQGWKPLAARASRVDGSPLARIVETLFELARK